MGDRHPARTEAFQLHLIFDAVDFAFQLACQISGGDGNLHFARQSFGAHFLNVHFLPLIPAFGGLYLVRAEGLEPPHLSVPEPKSGASTNSATPA